nr:retrovirus-related Pol polyprotein from transposon TNT 1-94 [Tanacetum cinerariifolium]
MISKNDEAKMVLNNALPKKEYEGIFIFNTIITSLKALDEYFSSRNHIRKFLRALPSEWRPKVTAIEESKDLSKLSLDELVCNLKVYEIVLEKDLEIAKNKKEKYKSLALKSRQVLSDEDASSSDSNDKEYAMVVRDFKKFFIIRGKFVRQPYNEKKNFRKIKEDKKKDQRCFKCDDPNHFISDCPKISLDDQKAFVVGSWSDSGDDFKKEEICLMAHSNEVRQKVNIELDEWIQDNGCSRHMTGNKDLFSYYEMFNEEPKNIKEAIQDESWTMAMQEELNQFKTNDVWSLIPPPKNQTIIGNAKEIHLEDSKPIKTPMSSEIKLTRDEDEEPIDGTKYHGMIGSLLYLTASRPDIMFSVCLCARFQEAPKTSHLEAVKRIFRYLKGCCLTSWFSKKQIALAISTTEAEYVFIEKACQQALWMKQVLVDYNVKLDDVPVLCDNKGAIDLRPLPTSLISNSPISPTHHNSDLLTTPRSTPPPLTSLPPAPTQPSKLTSPLAINLDPIELFFSTPPTYL